MFNRGPSPDPNQPKPPSAGLPPLSSTPPPVTGRSVASPFERTSEGTGTSVIGTDLTIMGEKITIISQNKVTVDGDVHGDIHGRQVVIGEEGSVVGTVNADSIEVRGGIKGAIRAKTVTLHPTAHVEGDITHQTLSIAEGAQFDGRVRRAKEPSELTPNLDVSAFETIRMAALNGAS